MTALLCSHPLKCSLSSNPVRKPLILLGMATEPGPLRRIVFTPAGSGLSATAPAGMGVWLMEAVLAVLTRGLEKARKA